MGIKTGARIIVIDARATDIKIEIIFNFLFGIPVESKGKMY